MNYGRSIAFEVTLFGWLKEILLDTTMPEMDRYVRAYDLLRFHGYTNDSNGAPAVAEAPEGITP